MSSHDEERTHPGLAKSRVTWMRDDMAKQAGLDTEEKKQEYFRNQEDLAEREAEIWLKEKLVCTAGKPLENIPAGSYCYTFYIPEDKTEEYQRVEKTYGVDSTEAFVLSIDIGKTISCPYQEYTDHGTVKCNFLEEESVGMSEEHYDEALKFFGSDDVMEEKCTGSIVMADAVKCCNRVLDAIKGLSLNKKD